MAKHKQTQIKDISEETKKYVLERQHGKSISGAVLSNYNVSFHHVVSRGNQGVGFDFNVVAITFDEHRQFHDGQNIKVNGRDRYTPEEFETLMWNHLKLNYSGVSKETNTYHKYWEEEDYRKCVKPHKPF